MKIQNAKMYGYLPEGTEFRLIGHVEDVVIGEHQYTPTFYEPAAKAEFSCVICESANREQAKINRFFRAMMEGKRKVVKWRGKKMLVSKTPQRTTTIRVSAGMGKTLQGFANVI